MSPENVSDMSMMTSAVYTLFSFLRFPMIRNDSSGNNALVPSNTVHYFLQKNKGDVLNPLPGSYYQDV